MHADLVDMHIVLGHLSLLMLKGMILGQCKNKRGPFINLAVDLNSAAVVLHILMRNKRPRPVPLCMLLLCLVVKYGSNTLSIIDGGIPKPLS